MVRGLRELQARLLYAMKGSYDTNRSRSDWVRVLVLNENLRHVGACLSLSVAAQHQKRLARFEVGLLTLVGHNTSRVSINAVSSKWRQHSLTYVS